MRRVTGGAQRAPFVAPRVMSLVVHVFDHAPGWRDSDMRGSRGVSSPRAGGRGHARHTASRSGGVRGVHPRTGQMERDACTHVGE